MKTGWANRETSSKLNICYAVSQKENFFPAGSMWQQAISLKAGETYSFHCSHCSAQIFLFMGVYIPLFTYMCIRNHRKSLTGNYPARKCNLTKMKNGNKNISSVITQHFNINKTEKKCKFSVSELN